MTIHDLALRYLDQIHEIPGKKHHPLIQWCHMLCNLDLDTPDEIPWCSSFVNMLAWTLELPRSHSAAARSWLLTGLAVEPAAARVGQDVVVLKRGTGAQPGPEVTSGASGHVGVFSGFGSNGVWLVGGNQGNGVTRQWFSEDRILGIRRLGTPPQ